MMDRSRIGSSRGLRRDRLLAASLLMVALGVSAAWGRALPGPQPRAPGLPQTVAVPGAPQSLAIVPGSILIMAGQPQAFRLLDGQKHPVRGAAWSISDPSLAEFKTSGDSATLTGLARSRLTLTATWRGLTAQARITVIGESALSPASSDLSAEWFRITPDKATLILGEAREFRLVDVNGRQIKDAEWSASDPGLAGIRAGSDAFFTSRGLGRVTVTADSQGHHAEAVVTIVAGPALPEGTVKWSVKELPGFVTTRITPAVPSSSGVDIFASEADACGRSIVRALTADGLEVWRRQLTPGVNPAAPDKKSEFKLSDGACPHAPPASRSARR